MYCIIVLRLYAHLKQKDLKSFDQLREEHREFLESLGLREDQKILYLCVCSLELSLKGEWETARARVRAIEEIQENYVWEWRIMADMVEEVKRESGY